MTISDEAWEYALETYVATELAHEEISRLRTESMQYPEDGLRKLRLEAARIRGWDLLHDYYDAVRELDKLGVDTSTLTAEGNVRFHKILEQGVA